MKKWIVKSNEWYDNRVEPARFFIFIIPATCLITILTCCHNYKLVIADAILLIILVMWRILGRLFNQDKWK